MCGIFHSYEMYTSTHLKQWLRFDYFFTPFLKVKVGSILKFVFLYLERVRFDYNKQTIRTRPKEEKPLKTTKTIIVIQLTNNLIYTEEIFVICMIQPFFEPGLLNSSSFPFLKCFLFILQYIGVNIEYIAID